MQAKESSTIKRWQRPSYPPWQAAFSDDALRRAWLVVRANKGRSGSDGETVAEFERHLAENLRSLQGELVNGRYRPQKVTQVLIPKPSGSWRPITLWTVRDKVAQRAVYHYLEPVFEQRFLPCSYGFRPGQATRDAAQAIQKARQAGACWVLDADIKDCFGSMDNRLLLGQLRRWHTPGPIRDLVSRWLHAEIWNAWADSPAVAGTSQGGVISPLMCNVYLHAFDQAWQKPGVWLVRFADDFVILSRSKQAIRWARHWSKVTLGRLRLTLHPQKTRITSFEEGFQFVGWFFVRDEMHELK
jgi:group II intron reverse transcriptase/maturase